MPALLEPTLEVRGRRLIRRRGLRQKVPFSDKHIWDMERRGIFPKRVSIGPNAVAWFEDEVEAWIAARIRSGGRAPKRREAPADAA